MPAGCFTAPFPDVTGAFKPTLVLALAFDFAFGVDFEQHEDVTSREAVGASLPWSLPGSVPWDAPVSDVAVADKLALRASARRWMVSSYAFSGLVNWSEGDDSDIEMSE